MINNSVKENIIVWRKKIFWMLWVTYASFYLCRVNISVALPKIMNEFSLTKTSMGLVLTSLTIFYAFGQFINGQIGDKINSRLMITTGLFISALFNLLFGFSGGILGAMLVIWGLNGYFQSMGWGPTVKALANWFPSKIRGKFSGRLGTSYILGGALSLLLAGFIIKYLNWRWTFWIPAAICILMAFHWYIRGRNAPEEVGLPTLEEQAEEIETREVRKDEHIGFRSTLKITLMNPAVWLIGLALLCLNIVRYGFMSWAPTYMFEEQGATISMAAFKTVALPVAGCLGAIFAGWISDRIFKYHRVRVSFIMFILLGTFCYLFRLIPGSNWKLSLICLLLIGFMTYGPHVLMVCALPMDLGSRKAASSVTGFIDSMGYVGASLVGVGTGYLVDNFGWAYAFYFWIASAFFAAILMLLLWNYKPQKREYE